MGRPHPPPRPGRQTRNLMADDDDGNDQTRATHRPAANGALQPAPRIVSRAEDQNIYYRPPFLLAILFTPFSLIYRLVYGSFRLLGTIFPFLPRFLNLTAGPFLQGFRRSTTGRRALGPKDTAARFIREFEEEYGTSGLPFLENGYNMALERAHQELKFLLVILMSPEHDDTSAWVRDTLLSPEVVGYIRSAQADLLVWGGSVRDSEAYQVSNSLRCTKFPFASVIVHTPSVSSTAMSVVARIAGNTAPSEFVDKLRTAVAQNKESLDRIRASRAEQQASRSLREQQDSAYERSLAIDRERARQRREAEAARQRAEQELADRQAAEARRVRDLAQWRAWRAQSLAPEPGPEVKDAVRISIRMPSGERVVRRFAPDAEIEELYAFVECSSLLSRGSASAGPENEAAEAEDGKEVREGSGNEEASIKGEKALAGPVHGPVQKPEGYQHQFGFRLVSPMPRVVYAVDDGGRVSEKIGRGGNLLVESIDEDEE